MVVASLTSGKATSVTNTAFGRGKDDVVSARNTVLGTAVVVVDGVSATRTTLWGAGVDGALVLFIVLGGWWDVIGFSLLRML